MGNCTSTPKTNKRKKSVRKIPQVKQLAKMVSFSDEKKIHEIEPREDDAAQETRHEEVASVATKSLASASAQAKTGPVDSKVNLKQLVA
jgi:hypothetical protein